MNTTVNRDLLAFATPVAFSQIPPYMRFPQQHQPSQQTVFSLKFCITPP
jgi:hypothetical protein